MHAVSLRAHKCIFSPFPPLFYFFYLQCFACCSIRNFWKASYWLFYLPPSLLLCFFPCLYFFFLTEGKGEPAGFSNATATSCCSLPIQASKVPHPSLDISCIKHESWSFCLFSLTPGLAACLHQHNIVFVVFLTCNLESSTPPHLDSLLYLARSSPRNTKDVWFPTHFSLK